ncbi:ATP-dependent zinc metalloprotease FtsH [Gilvimarinus sp. SDUM040013]|uniref:ATP-dependent zinc metalloprotease FtsH n=1 Tax=Gilvimarinus gilvus TaxID=3058038 RepID=A0ABU4S0U0_9GAMM|nr:ATP-dependent zinc metalloprotease FtsH [Gilvimarinus sp. SDUM040013]MDO3387208.1 ATP-dependent zinc metalloprotease FtsH [Gilvimarinus sp. SDUM040013]MDX6850771.1 ATP-dependent zinc metalloprotease FtsH [Gilvimarinus sp. SDUM040013]
MTKNLILWLIIAAVLFSVFQGFNQPTQSNAVTYSEFVTAVEQDRVREVTIQEMQVRGVMADNSRFTTNLPLIRDEELMPDLRRHDVEITVLPREEPSLWHQLLVASFPILIIIAVFLFFMRQMQGGGGGGRGGPMSFGKSKARLLGEDQIKTTFADVAGVDEAKEEVQELVEYLRDPSKFQRLGGQIPRGVLMSGPPGTGKTLLAKAIAGEAKVPFFSISGSDFVEMFVGVGASRVRDMFEQAKKQSPCIIFIDEIDAVGRHRGGGHGGGHDEREQTLNQLLVEMDGFEGNEGVIVIAATNRPDVLDKALLRPGRFDRQVVVGLPDIRGREQVLKVHMRKVPISESVEASVIARGTPGFSGADLANLVNEAALFAARANKRLVSMEEFEKARDKIMMGAERRSMVMSEQEKENTAYHEAGHAIVGRLVPEHDPIHKVTIIPRGRALGVTQFLPESDKYSLSRRAIESQICTLFGGRIAEQMTLGDEGITTGASNDIERATDLSRNMVTKWGLSEKLGPLHYGEDEGMMPGTGSPNYSGATSKIIDEEVREIVDRCYKRAEELLHENRDILEAMKDALVEYETIDSEQVDDLMSRRKVRPPRDWHDGDFNNHIGGGGVSDDETPQEPKDGKTGPIGGPAEDH